MMTDPRIDERTDKVTYRVASHATKKLAQFMPRSSQLAVSSKFLDINRHLNMKDSQKHICLSAGEHILDDSLLMLVTLLLLLLL